MNLYKTALSLIICSAPASARLSSDEKDSSAVMRELMAMKSEFASLKADNEALKSKVASLEKRRGLMPDLEGMELPDIELPKEMTDILDIEVDPSSGGGPPFPEILFGIINQLVGLKRCVGFDPNSVGRRLSGERRLPGYPSGGTCFFGGEDIDAVFMEADEYIQVGSVGTDEVFIASNTFVGLKSGVITDLSNARLSQAFQTHRTFGPVNSGNVQINGDFFTFNPNFPQQPKSSFLPSVPVFSLSTAAANSTDDSV